MTAAYITTYSLCGCTVCWLVVSETSLIVEEIVGSYRSAVNVTSGSKGKRKQKKFRSRTVWGWIVWCQGCLCFFTLRNVGEIVASEVELIKWWGFLFKIYLNTASVFNLGRINLDFSISDISHISYLFCVASYVSYWRWLGWNGYMLGATLPSNLRSRCTAWQTK